VNPETLRTRNDPVPLKEKTMTGVSTARLAVLRAAYLLIVVGLTLMIWPGIINHPADVEHMRGVMRSLLGGVSILALLGLRYPLQMLPVLLFELIWKTIWLVAFALPINRAGVWTEGTRGTLFDCVFGVVVCLIAIPWGYVFAQYVRKPAEPVRGTSAKRSGFAQPVA
jgi:hypothetical protein